MKKLLVILLLIFAANIVKAQTGTSPKIHLWADEGNADYTIANELWTKLGDSRIYNKLGTYGYSFKWDTVKENDFIVYIQYIYMPNSPGNTTVITIHRVKKIDGYNDLIYKTILLTTNISDQHISQSVECCYKQILEWHDEFMK